MPKHLNEGYILLQIRDLLAAKGPLDANEICALTHISQPSFSRLIKKQPQDSILILGKTKKTKYALKRKSSEFQSPIPVYAVDEKGKTKHITDLNPIAPKGFVWSTDNLIFKDLPYFLDDLRPSGFLGRAIPKLHPELGYAEDVRNWTQDQCLGYLTRYGANTVGQFILGDQAYEYFQKQNQNSENPILNKDRAKLYPKLAEAALKSGNPGSSAGGEQPKFLVETESGHVIVKFSPSNKESVGKRMADLLICEHLALRSLGAHGFVSSKSEIIQTEGRIFLEAVRFDRTDRNGRKGIISLQAFASEFIGMIDSWEKMGTQLFLSKKISNSDMTTIHQLALFAKLIANTDCHAANLSFYFENLKYQGLAPVYDMLPMLYAPQQGQLVERNLDIPSPNPKEKDIWQKILPVAIEFWIAVTSHDLISPEFKSIAKKYISELGISQNELERIN